MKDKWKLNPLLRIVALFFVLIILFIGAGIGLFYILFSIPEPEGLSLATWPNRFTDNFSIWMKNDKGILQIEDIGLERLDEYGLWLQVIDETGQEVISHNKPENFPTKYTASELMAFSTSDYEDGYTVFVSSFEEDEQTWNYLIGFPYDVGKYMLYYNGEVVGRLKPVFTLSLFGVIFAGSALLLIYGIWLTHQTGKIAKGIGNISRRVYTTIPEKGTFGSVYMALNKMNEEIRHSDQIKEETDRVRREWITNITHDLKTPLSPVKGYAELLADGTDVDTKTAQEYGTIILKNVDYAEKLMNISMDELESFWNSLDTDHNKAFSINLYSDTVALRTAVAAKRRELIDHRLDNKSSILVHSDFCAPLQGKEDSLYNELNYANTIQEITTDNICCLPKGRIGLTSILKYKGLENHHIILVIPARPIKSSYENFLFEIYVGMTRAIMNLDIFVLNI